MASQWQEHVARWGACTQCGLCETRTKVVLGRGRVPCDVLFVGEAPGRSEDVVGKPFVGPAGKLLDLIIRRAGYTDQPAPGGCWTYAMTNMVCCLPLDDDGEKTSEPPDDAVQACGPRLAEMVRLADPRLIVCVGKLPHEYLDVGYRHSVKLHKICGNCRRHPGGRAGGCAACGGDHPTIDIPRIGIIHPAAILRMNVILQGIAVQRAAAVLGQAIDVFVEKYL